MLVGIKLIDDHEREASMHRHQNDLSQSSNTAMHVLPSVQCVGSGRVPRLIYRCPEVDESGHDDYDVNAWQPDREDIFETKI